MFSKVLVAVVFTVKYNGAAAGLEPRTQHLPSDNIYLGRYCCKIIICCGVCRAKFITGSVQLLLAKPEGGRQWLLSLRDKPYKEAAAALCELPGVGPKVSSQVSPFGTH